MRWLLLSLAAGATLAAIVACGDSTSTNPAGGSSGLPNQNGTSSGDTTSSGGTSGGTKKPDAGQTDDDDDTEPPSGPANVRIMAANISSGTKQSYDPGEGIRIFQALKPDVVMIQEFNYGDKSEATMRQFVTDTFGQDYSYFRESGAGFDIPNGVISKYAILDSGHIDSGQNNRGFAWAKIQVPGTHPLWAFSVHLATSSSDQDPEAKTLVGEIKKMVATDDYVVIGGDFNTKSRNDACLTTFNAVVDAAGSHAADGLGGENTNTNRKYPYDWVLASPNLVTNQVATVIGNNSFAKGLVFDSRLYTPLADVAPVKKDDSDGANGMQHMAIVKDFRLD